MEISSLEVERKTITNEKNIAESLNHHFVTVGPKLASKLEFKPDDDSLKHTNYQQNTIIFVSIDGTNMLNAIRQLKNGKVSDPDKAPTTLIKDATDFIWKRLTMVFNSSLKYGIFPDIWQLVKVTPNFRQG